MAAFSNSPFTSIQGNNFSFSCQSCVLRLIDTPSTRRKMQRLSTFHKIRPCSESCPQIYYNFIIETPGFEPPLCHCSNFVATSRLYFLEEDYKHSVEFQMECIHSLNTWSARELNPYEMFSWKDDIMWPWVHYIFTPIHGEGLNISSP